MKKVIKNLPEPNLIPIFEKKINATVTYYDGKKGEMHVTDNATGKKWRSSKSVLELICALMDGAALLEMTSGSIQTIFIPEDYKA